ncbi:phospholipase D3-like isoform X3 [Zootermopsis nevadensis]|uniref:phospholipase D3-like isoform X3 n=1 Tax=Zootermopsis nevadensis TaxID=136037 RepID=UPI000B8E8009|nr:phospholipase D3-like isoform X3 [Zootermopsis nevadensis]
MVQLGKQAVKKSSGSRIDGATEDTEFELWDSRFMLRGDHEPEIGYNHARWGPRGWCKPSCIPITIILILIVLVVLLPLMEQKEVDYAKSSSISCPQTCRFSLVESIPEGLTYPNSTVIHPSTHDVWFGLIKLAQHSIEIGSFYWTLRSADVTPGDPSSQKGEEIFQALLTSGMEKKVNIRIAQNFPSQSQSALDTEILAKKGAAEVRSVNFPKLMGGGVLHTKLWIVDEQHFYVGSANMDWRSLTEVKELGLAVYNCSCLASDLAKIFEVYWFLGNTDVPIPAKWPDSLSTHFNIETPVTLTVNSSSKADVYIASSPAPLCPSGRSTDIDAILDVISKAEHFIYIAVMDYFPLQIYTPKPRYWPKIDDALRAAAVDRHVQVHLLISNWNHTRKATHYFLRSLVDISGSYRGVVVEVKWFKVPSTPEQAKIPFARVNHNKYMVTDNAAYIGTSNWSGDYFTDTAGVGIVVRASQSKNDTSSNPLRDHLQQVFERDWNSSYASPLVE